MGAAPSRGEEPRLAACATEGDLKKALAQDGLKPKEIGERCRRILAGREIRANIAALEEAVATVLYQAVDARDEAAVKAALKTISSQLGPVKGLIHGAGVLADKRLEDKTLEQFDAVWATKVTALRHILSALDLSQLKGAAFFSSSTARYGRLGQSDYAMANEALNKAAQLLSRRLPHARLAAIGWGPWDGGMVTDSLKPLFEAEGVGLIGLEAGGALLVSELSEENRAVELLVLGQTASLPEPAAPAAAAAVATRAAFERAISLEDWPLLSSHVINGRAVLPTALITEMLGHGALHGQPGLSYHGLDNLRIYKGVLLRAEQSSALKVLAGKPVKRDGLLIVPVELRGENGVLHAGASVVLTPVARPPSAPLAGRMNRGRNAWEAFHGKCGSLKSSRWKNRACRSTARPRRRRQWLRHPGATVGWATGRAGRGVSSDDRLDDNWARPRCQFRGAVQAVRRFSGLGRRCRCPRDESRRGIGAGRIEVLDESGRLVARLEGYECTVDASLAGAFRRAAVEA